MFLSKRNEKREDYPSMKSSSLNVIVKANDSLKIRKNIEFHFQNQNKVTALSRKIQTKFFINEINQSAANRWIQICKSGTAGGREGKGGYQTSELSVATPRLLQFPEAGFNLRVLIQLFHRSRLEPVKLKFTAIIYNHHCCQSPPTPNMHWYAIQNLIRKTRRFLADRIERKKFPMAKRINHYISKEASFLRCCILVKPLVPE